MGELYISTSGAVSRMHQLETIANNLANVDTLGFKADRTQFQMALESQVRDVDGDLARGAPARAFVQTAGTNTDHAGGNVVQTGRGLDAAIQGPGFFAVETPGGVRYTRAGSFIVDANGNLATLDGRAVLGDGGPINVGGSEAHILASGDVVDTEENVLGRLRVEAFDDPRALEKEGTNLFKATPAAVGLPPENLRLVPGSVERSNVQAIRELATMMILQRGFDATLQVMKSDDQATDQLIREFSQ